MSKKWFYFLYNADGISNPTCYPVDVPSDCHTILRMLISVTFAGMRTETGPYLPFNVPILGMSIGYDPESNHNGEVMDPLHVPAFPFLYTEFFTPQLAFTPTDTGLPQTTYMAGTDAPRSVEGQRRIFLPNRSIFFQATMNNDLISESTAVDWWVYCHMRMLYQ